MTTPPIMTRRSALLLAGSGLGLLPRLNATSGDFWNKKDPSVWSSDERDKLLTKSPWAKEVTATMTRGDGGSGSPGRGGYPGGGYPGGGGVPRGRVGIGMPGGGMGGGRRYPRGGNGRMRGSAKGTVRWESAQPVLEANRKPLPEEFADCYVVSIDGFPLPARRRDRDDEDASSNPANRSQDDTLNDIKQNTILQPKGKSLVEGSVVQRKGSMLLFGFPKKALDLSADDKEVEFQTRLPRAVIKAKFNLKDMRYHGKLAV